MLARCGPHCQWDQKKGTFYFSSLFLHCFQWAVRPSRNIGKTPGTQVQHARPSVRKTESFCGYSIPAIPLAPGSARGFAPLTNTAQLRGGLAPQGIRPSGAARQASGRACLPGRHRERRAPIGSVVEPGARRWSQSTQARFRHRDRGHESKAGGSIGAPPNDWKAPGRALWYELRKQIPVGVGTASDRAAFGSSRLDWHSLPRGRRSGDPSPLPVACFGGRGIRYSLFNVLRRGLAGCASPGAPKLYD